MAVLRLLLLIAVVVAFFVVAAPIQAVLAGRRSRHALHVPLLFCRTMLRLLHVDLDVEGAVADDGPTLLVVNHVSWIDILALGSTTPFCFLAKREVASWPLVSTFARLQGTVFVERLRRRAIPPANRDLADRLLEGRKVLLFPEGTTFDGRAPGPFFAAHFAAARDLLRGSATHETVAVQPVALAYTTAQAAWIGDDTLMPHLWRVLRGPPMRCLVAFGTPIVYRRDSDRKAVARQSRQAVAKLLARARRRRPAYAWTEATSAPPTDEDASMTPVATAATRR